MEKINFENRPPRSTTVMVLDASTPLKYIIIASLRGVRSCHQIVSQLTQMQRSAIIQS